MNVFKKECNETLNKKLVFDFDGTLVDSMNQWAGKMLYVLQKNNIEYPKDIIAEMDEYALPEYTYNIPIKKDVDLALKGFLEKGFSLNVLTASPHRMLDVCLKRNGIYDLFDNIWSCEDFSTTKSDVNIYHRVAERLGCSVKDCIFFDDNIGALATAKKAGMKVVGVYDQSSAEYEQEIRALCDEYIYNIIDFKGA